MMMVGVDDSSLQVDSQSKSVGFVWGLLAAWRLVCIHRMNWVNSCNGPAMMTINTVIGISKSLPVCLYSGV